MFQFDDRGLMPAIVQDASSGEVLMLAYMNEDALRRTLEGPDAWFYSRSRRELWHKGETSGNFLKVQEVRQDCDGDALLVRVTPEGPACHTGERTCFYQPAVSPGDMDEEDAIASRTGPGVLDELRDIIASRKSQMPEGSYTTKLFQDGAPRIAQKVVEEAGETAIAALTETGERMASEMADMLYHALVLLEETGVSADRVWEELKGRRR